MTAFIPALPKMAQELGVSPDAVGLIISVYTLPGVIFMPLFGVLADRLGRRKVLVPALMLFGITGGLCGLVRDFNLLLTLRFLQGVGAASLVPLSWVIICDIYSGGERLAATGYNASLISVGMAGFPALGGALALLSWQYPFLLSLFAIAVGLLVLLALKNPEPNKEQRMGKYLREFWNSLKNLDALGLFVVNAFAFLVVYGAYMTYFPFLIESSFGASSLIIGLFLAMMFLIAAATASQLGKLARIFSRRNLLRLSFLLYALALILIPLAPSLWLMPVLLVIFGVAQGLNEPVVMTLMADMVPINHRAAFLAVNEMLLLLGITLGPILMGAIFGAWGISSVFFAGAGLAFAMFFVSLFAVK